jgi:hypothetical protein
MNNLIAKYDLPYSIVIPRKTKKDRIINLNMNVYRNLHYAVNNQIKKIFQPIKIESIKKKYSKIIIEYYIKRKDNRKYDIMNTVAVVDKFFCDWLVENKYIEDDNSKIIQQYHVYTDTEKYNENIITALIYEA